MSREKSESPNNSFDEGRADHPAALEKNPLYGGEGGGGYGGTPTTGTHGDTSATDGYPGPRKRTSRYTPPRSETPPASEDDR